MPSDPDDELDDETIVLMIDLNEMPGEPAAFDTPQDAMEALAHYVDILPEAEVQLHQKDCDPDTCGCEWMPVSYIVPTAKA